jgi:D-arabinose 1-dehydrogenase-like Zn-dependent alcohol dehydrogenase
MRSDVVPGAIFPDYELSDHSGKRRRLSEVTPAQLIFGTRAIEGSLTGAPLDCEDTLAFSALEGIRPTIETVPLEAATEAYGKMMREEARFRMGLVTGQ